MKKDILGPEFQTDPLGYVFDNPIFAQACDRSGLSRREFLKIFLAATTVLLVGCERQSLTPTPQTPENLPTPTSTEVVPAITPAVPAGSGTETPNTFEIRRAVTAEMAKNVEPSLEIGSGEVEVSIFPDNSSDILKNVITSCYKAIQKSYPGSTVYFDQDTAPGGTGYWIVYGITPEGKLIQSIVRYGESGGIQYGDYPIRFDLENQEMIGEYDLLDIPGGRVGVIWVNGLPQLLANEVIFDNDRFFTEYLVYTTLYPDNPWVYIQDFSELGPSVEEIDNILHDNCYYGRSEIDSFRDISYQIVIMNDTPYNVLIGIDQEGQEKILAAEMTTYSGERVWTRISVTDLGGDNGKMIMWINPDQDGAIQVNEETAEIFMTRFLEVVRDGGQGASITGMQAGKITLEVPYALYEQGGPDVRWVEETLDLQDVEIRIFQSPEEWQEFARNYPEMAAKVFSRSFGRSGSGVCIFPKVDGGSLMTVLQTAWDISNQDYWYGVKPIEDEDYFRSIIESDVVYPDFWVPLSVYAYYRDGRDAFVTASLVNGFIDYPLSNVIGSFNILSLGFMESLP